MKSSKDDADKTQVQTINLVKDENNKYTFVVNASFYNKNYLTFRSADPSLSNSLIRRVPHVK